MTIAAATVRSDPGEEDGRGRRRRRQQLFRYRNHPTSQIVIPPAALLLLSPKAMAEWGSIAKEKSISSGHKHHGCEHERSSQQ